MAVFQTSPLTQLREAAEDELQQPLVSTETKPSPAALFVHKCDFLATAWAPGTRGAPSQGQAQPQRGQCAGLLAVQEGLSGVMEGGGSPSGLQDFWIMHLGFPQNTLCRILHSQRTAFLLTNKDIIVFSRIRI